MIKNIEINYPDFGLELKQKFNDDITIIEKPNGWGKTTILNTILASHMMKYPVGKAPKGTAKIETSDGNYLYSKGVWVGTGKEQNVNMKYIIPGKFFEETPKTQRQVIVDMLGVDYESFMAERVPNWTPDYASRIKKEANENKGKEDILLDNIQRLKSQVIIYENKPITIVDNSQRISAAYKEWHTQANEQYNIVTKHNNEVQGKRFHCEAKLNELQNKFNSNENEMNKLRNEFVHISKDCKCNTCNQNLPEDKKEELKQSIQVRGKALKQQNEELEIQIAAHKAELTSLVLMDVPRQVPFVFDIALQAETVKIPLEKTSDEEMELVKQYEYNKKELALYEQQLKDLNKINYQDVLESIAQANKEFTTMLEQKIKDSGLDGISLFRIKSDGEPTETFEIQLNGKTYNELSTGNKQILHIRMATFFSKILGLDFILMDEMGTVSEETWEQIKKEVSGLQFIGFRAEPFKFSKRKSTKTQPEDEEM